MADPQGGVRLFPDGTRMGCARVTSRYHNERRQRHGRDENEKSPGFTTETKAFC
jgi:hypothetical protein